MEKRSFQIREKEITLYLSDTENRPLVILHLFQGDGSDVADLIHQDPKGDCNLLCIGNLDWSLNMTPWPAEAMFRGEESFGGGAGDYLPILLEEILPKGKQLVKGSPVHTAIAGYSLAGLFALYALYQTPVFDRAASVSGSLWYPGFLDYAKKHSLQNTPQKLYLSLGDKENRSKNRVLQTVLDQSRALAEHYKESDIDTVWELNEGNHFCQPPLRTAKGILAIL